MPFEVKVSVDSILLKEPIAKQVQRKFNTMADDLAKEFREKSPVGATGELKGGWEIRQPRQSSSEVGITVGNYVPDALQRVAGTAPGNRPEIVPLTRWVESKKIARGDAARWIAILISKNIEKIGSLRWREGGNYELGINRKGSPIKDGLVEQYTRRLEQELNRMEIK